MLENGSGVVVCSLSLLICSHPGRGQAETPLIRPVQKPRASSLGLRVFDIFPERGLVPSEAGVLVGGRVRKALNHASLPAKQAVEHRADRVLCGVADLMAGAALQEQLFA